MNTPDSPTRSAGAGVGYAVSAYLIWGLFPLYFLLLVPVGPLETVAWRVLLGLVACVLLVTVSRGWHRLLAIIRDRRTTLIIGLAGVFIAINWLIYIYAVDSGHVIEASLGYFTNPVVTVLLGVIVRRERLRPLQWVSVGISVVAIVVLAVAAGSFPWIALLLAFSFGLYGLIKKQVGGSVDALSGLTLETAWLAVPAAAVVLVLAVNGNLVTGTISAWHTVLVMCAGIVTAVPLLLFASAARRLSLVAIGLTQYLTPVLQLIIGAGLLHEEMPLARWIGFAIVWIALIVLTFDLIRANRRVAASAPA